MTVNWCGYFDCGVAVGVVFNTAGLVAVGVTVAVLVGVAVSCLITAGVEVGKGVLVGSTVVRLQASGSKKARPRKNLCHKGRCDMIRSSLQISDSMISVLQSK